MKKPKKTNFLLLSNSENVTIEGIRAKLLSWMLMILNVLILPIVVMGIIEAVNLGLTFMVVCYVIYYFIVLFTTLYYKKTPYILSTLVLLFSAYGMGLLNLIVYGFGGAGIHIFFATIVLTTVFLGLRYGFIAIAICAISMLVTAYLIINNTLMISVDLLATSVHLTSWLTAITVTILLATIMVLGYGVMQYNLLFSLKTVRKQAYDLRLANEKQVEDLHNMTIIMDELKIAKEKSEESDKLKAEFIHNMSHELRTPLNGVIGFSQLLGLPKLSDEDKASYLEIVKNCGDQLLKVVEDILEISVLETKQVKSYESEVNLNSLLHELLMIFNMKSKEKNIELHLINQLPNEDSMIMIDELKLNKILSNIIENAFKFTNEGSIEFGYKIINDNIELYVKDTGAGISPENQQKIFDRFSQEDKELSRSVGGIGLGLSIAKENASLLGGKITVESEKGKGSTFLVTIPYVKAI